MAFKITVTNAGRAALVNAASNGTNVVLLAAAGVSAATGAYNEATTAISGEIKRLTSMSGNPLDSATLAVNFSDQSTDFYDCRTIALYTNNGVLFAFITSATPIFSKLTDKSAQFSFAAKFADINVSNIIFNNPAPQPPANESNWGVVKRATDAEAAAGTEDSKFITSKKLWANINSAIASLSNSINASITALASQTLPKTIANDFDTIDNSAIPAATNWVRKYLQGFAALSGAAFTGVISALGLTISANSSAGWVGVIIRNTAALAAGNNTFIDFYHGLRNSVSFWAKPNGSGGSELEILITPNGAADGTDRRTTALKIQQDKSLYLYNTPIVNGSQVWHAGNTPAVIASGSGIGYRWRKWSDGTIEQWGAIGFADLSNTTAFNVTFPVAFSNAYPFVSTGLQDVSQFGSVLVISNLTATGMTLQAHESDTNIAGGAVNYYAIGF